jgi:hypothetical protein
MCHTSLCRKNEIGIINWGSHKFILGSSKRSQNTTSQPEVQGTQAKHEQHYQEDLDNLGTSGRLITGTGRHLKCTEKFLFMNGAPHPILNFVVRLHSRIKILYVLVVRPKRSTKYIIFRGVPTLSHIFPT